MRNYRIRIQRLKKCQNDYGSSDSQKSTCCFRIRRHSLAYRVFEKSIATSEFKFAIYNLGEGMLIYSVKGEEGKWVGWNIQIFVGVGIYTLNE